MSQESEEPQWFITSDGEVLQSWPPGPDNDRLKYVRFTTTRRVWFSDLYTLDERLDAFTTAADRRSAYVLVVAGLDVLGIVFVWLVLPRLGVGDGLRFALTAVLVLFLVFGGPLIRKISGASRAGFDQLYLDAGLESSVPTVLKDHEAQALLDAPGTVAGRRARGARR